MTDPRPSWDEYFLAIARAVSIRGDCTRRQVGAVIFDPVTRDLIDTGYNGPPAGQQGCLSAGACPRGRHYLRRHEMLSGGILDSCACGNSVWPCPEAVDPGSSYDTGPGMCIALHAEQNAVIRAGRSSRGMRLAVTEEPCDGCLKLLRGAGIVQIITPAGNLKL